MGAANEKDPVFTGSKELGLVSKYSKALSTIAWISSGLPCELILALSGCFGLFLALYAGLFIVFTTTYFGQDAAAGSLALEPLKSTFQGLVFTYANFHQFPSPLNAT